MYKLFNTLTSSIDQVEIMCHILTLYKLTPISEELGVCPTDLFLSGPPPPTFFVWGEFLA